MDAATERGERIASLRLDITNERQRQFADAICEGLCRGEAYKRAYDTDPDHPILWRTCLENGSKLMGHPKVRAYIQAVMGQAVEECIINAAEVVAGLRDVATSGVVQGPGAGARVSALKILWDILQGGERKTVTLQGPDGKPIQTDNVHRGGLPDSIAHDLAKRLFGLPDAEG